MNEDYREDSPIVPMKEAMTLERKSEQQVTFADEI